MNDTSPEFQKLFDHKLMQHSGEQRFIMGALMFDAARDMALASFPENLSKDEVRQKLFLRLYGPGLKIKGIKF